MRKRRDVRQEMGPPVRPAASPGRSVALTGLAVAFSLFGDMTMYVVIPVHFESLGLTPLQVGVLLSANRWVRMVTNHLAERVSGRVAPLLLLVLSLIGGAATTAVYGLAPPFIFFLLVRLVWGMCWSFLRQIGVMNAVTSAAAGRVGRILGVYDGVVRIGFVAGTFAGGVFFDALGYHSVFLLLAGISLAGVIPAVAGMRGRKRFEVSGGNGLAFVTNRKADWLTYLRGFLISTVGSGIIMSTLGHVLNERLPGGLPIGGVIIGIATINGVLLALRHSLQVIGSPLLGVFIDRVGILRSQLLLFATATAALTVAFLKVPVGLVVIMIVVFFLSETALALGLMVQAGMRGSKRYARLATAMDLGSAAGPIAGWTAVGLLLSSSWTFLIGAVCYLLGMVFTLMSMGTNGTKDGSGWNTTKHQSG
ncbi:MAG: MFS transporter [Spirochaetales bacterium]|nr:MFS transporter [Spirochaetales bacterium]